jgi:ABC-2 type transport system permease protein
MNTSIAGVRTIMQRELKAYFSTPVAWVFIVIFTVMAAAFTFYLGGFYQRGIADLEPFFRLHPWLYLFLVPALSMRLWAEERKSGTIELLLTLPMTLVEAIVGKFLAAWLFLGLALLLTVPIWFSVNYLGEPDNGVILAAYIGSWLMAGAFLAIGSCISALTRNQVVAFILSVAVCFGFLLSGLPIVLEAFRGWLPQVFVDGIANLSLISHFADISRGVLDLRDLVFFMLVIGFWLTANAIVLQLRKAD